ncbi:MAG: helix-turn-helix domain-containing protein, partial [Bacteroidales bacterium]|nr:helix-turn-helix domain-containing protein [Bacteroidales bacterium]
MDSQAQEYAARYHEQEQDLAVAEARAEAKRQRLQLWLLTLILLFVVLVLVLYAISHRRIREKNKALIRLINEQSSPAMAAPSKSDSADLSLFREIDAEVRSERLYANVALQRQDIIDRWKLRRQTLNDLLSAAGYDSFPAYINHLRLEESVRLLREQPELSITAIAQEVGFSAANFRLAFKQSYGITPAEYRADN